MRILLLSQFFDPEPTLKGLVFARALKREGFDVEVLTGFPNYPGGRLYPGFRRRLWQREEIDGIVIHRVWLYPSHDKSALRRIANYASFAVAAALIGPFLIRRPDAIYVHHPPPTVALPAVVIRFLTGAPYIYEVQDIWPDTLRATGMIRANWLLRLIGWCCQFIYTRADRLVVVAPGFMRMLVSRGVSESKVSLLYNWADEERLVPLPRDEKLAFELGIQNGFIVMFAGTLGLAQGLDTILDAAALCLERAPNVRFVVVGDGVERERLGSESSRRGLSNVHFVPRQPIERMGAILPLADVLLVHLRDDELFASTIPSKTQAYLRVGVPIIMAVRGDGAALLERSGGGVACAPGDPEALAAAIIELRSMSPEARANLGAAGRRFYEAELSVDAGVRRYGDWFRYLLGLAGSTT